MLRRRPDDTSHDSDGAYYDDWSLSYMPPASGGSAAGEASTRMDRPSDPLSASLASPSPSDGYAADQIEEANLDLKRADASLSERSPAYAAAESALGQSAAAELSTSSETRAPSAFATISTLASYLTNGYWGWAGKSPHHWASHTVSVNITGLNAQEQTLAKAALNAWHEVANISFTFTAGAANITYLHTSGGAATSVNWDGSGNITSATVNISSNWDVGASGGIFSYFFQTYVHETGHALGLGHQGPYNDNEPPGYHPTYTADAIYTNDTWQWSLMSYFDQSNYGNGSHDYAITPAMADIYAIQSLYGTTSTRTENNIYGFNNNSGSIYDLTQYSGTPSFTIYDSGGIDTLDFSGYSIFSQVINLTSGSWSSVGGYNDNIGIYTTTSIENAIGGGYIDNIIGNILDNTLRGRGGDDNIDGGDGTDTAVFAGQYAAYTLQDLGEDNIRVVGPDGTDTLKNIEKLAFDDRTIDWHSNHRPVVTASSITTTHGRILAAASLFTATDVDGNVLSYSFRDNTTGGGRFEYDGVAIAENQTFSVSQAQLSHLTFRAGNSGSDNISVSAYDGAASSTTVSFNINVTPNRAPTVTASSTTQGHGRALAASALFTASDADADPLSYWFRDNTAGGGHFEFDGNPIADQQTFGVDAAQLSRLTYRVGNSGGDNITVSAYDGLASSNTATFNVNVALNHAPTVSAPGTTAAHGRSLAASSLFTATDSDGDTLSYYFRDSTAGGGHFEYDGVAIADNQTFGINASQLSRLTYRVGNSGADNLSVSVFDGLLSSSTVVFNVNVALNHAPTASGASASVAHGRTVAASTLFAAGDSDGDALSYWFRDNTAGGGHFEYDGNPIADNQTFGVDASQLSRLTYRAGNSGTDNISVSAFDGLLSSSTVTSTVAVAINHAPTTTGANASVAHGRTVAAATLFSASDSDGDALSYWFRDNTAGGGHFEYDGNPIADNQTFGVDAGQLSHLTYRAGDSGADNISVSTFDGLLSSSTVAATVTVALNHAPTASASSTTAAHGRSLSASSLFTASDSDGDALSYWFRDNTIGGGHFAFDGVAIADQQTFGVDAAQLSRLTYIVGNSGGDNITVSAYDGLLSSNTATFNVNVALNHAPTVSAPNLSPARGQILSASNLFTASDSDADPLSYYFRDSPGGGRFEYDGAPIAEGQTFGVNASQLSHLTFRASSGAGNESVFVSVYDGLLSSATVEFHLFT